MIDAEHLQDAIGLLPEELLAPVDVLRKQKREVWKPVVAVAASLLLVVGLYHLQPVQKTADNGSFLEDAAEHAPADRGDGYVEEYAGNSIEHSTNLSAYFLTAKITEITENYLAVTLSDGKTAKVFLDHLEKNKEFSLSNEITLLFDQEPKNRKELYPKEILIN